TNPSLCGPVAGPAAALLLKPEEDGPQGRGYNRGSSDSKFLSAPCKGFLEASFRQLEQVFDERHHRAIESLNLRIRRFNDVIFVRRVRAAAVTQSEMSRGELEWFARENVAGIRTGVPRPEQRIDSELFISCGLRFYQR